MAAPSYATDLTTVVDFDGTPSSPSVAEPASTWTAGRSPTTDTDFPIQSSNHASLTMNTTGKAGILCTNGSTGTWSSSNYMFGWIVWLAPGAIAAEASGGLCMLVGSSTSAYKVFYIGGNASGSYPYGGWQNFAVDPTKTADETIGTPTAYNIVGAGANVSSAVSKGNPLGFDVFRYGRGELRVTAGDGTTPATFTGMAAANDASSARWGLFQAVPGTFRYKGKVILGYTSACTFVDANKNIVIDYQKYVNSDFNEIEIINASSNISWTNIALTSLSTVSLGNFTVTDNATVLLDTCVFTDMGTFNFLSNTSTPGTVFRRCGQVIGAGADLSGAVFEGYVGTADTSALVWNVATDVATKLVGTTFEMGATATHAIEFGTSSPTSITLPAGLTFTGYGADGSTSAAIEFKRTTGTVTVNYSGTKPTFKKPAGLTVVWVQSNNLTVNVDKDTTTEVRVYDAGTTTAVGGIENIGATKTYTLAIDAATYPSVDVAILSKDYINEYRASFSMTGGDKTIDIQQRVDRQFDNP